MKKKLLSLLLVLCMVIPMVPMTVLAAGTTVTFYDVDGGVLESVSANYGDLVECPAYTVEGETLLGWDVNGDGTADYSPVGTIVVQNGYTTVKPVVWVAPDEGHVPVNGEVSAFRDNLPAVDGASVVFKGHWQVGFYPYAGGTFTAFDAYASDTPNGGPRFVPASAGGNLWANGGMYISTDANNPTRYYASAIASAADAMVYSFIRDAEIKVDFNNVTVFNEGATGINLKVEFAIYKNDTKVWPEGDGWHLYDCGCTTHNTVYGNIAGHTGITLKEDLALSVEAGDEISFRVRRAGEKKVWLVSMAPSIEFVDVDENTAPPAPDTTVTSTSFGANMPTYDQNVALIGDYIYARGNWSMVNRASDNWSNAEILEAIQHVGSGNFADTKGQSAASKGTQVAMFPASAKGMDWGNAASPMTATQNHFGHSWNAWGALYGLNPNAAWNTGIRYVAEYAGNVSVDITKLIGSNTDASVNGKVYAAIFVDGTMVWPNVNGSYTDVSAWFEITGGDKLADAKASEGYAKLANIYVAKGSSIELLLKNNNVNFWKTMGSAADMTVTYKELAGENDVVVLNYDSGSVTGETFTKGDKYTFPACKNIPAKSLFQGWDINGDGVADYAANETIELTETISLVPVFMSTIATFNRDKVSYDNNYKIVMPENWSLLAHNSSNFNSTLVIDTIMNNKGDGWHVGVDTPAKGDIWIAPTQKGGLWDSYPAINWLSKGDRVGGYWGPWMGACPTGSWNVAYAYTAPNSGYVNVTIDNMIVDPSSTDYMAIFVGGIMVWPTAGGSYTNVGDWHYCQNSINDTNLTLLNNLFVEKGEKIEVMIKAGEFAGAVYVASSVEYVDTFDENQLYIKLPNPVAQVVPAVAGERVTLPEYAGSGAFLGWDADGDGVVDYADGQSFTMPNETVRLMPIMAAATTFHTNLPGYTANNGVTFNGGWKAGIYDIGAGKFIPFNYGQKSEVRFSFNNNAWGDTSGMYSNGRFAMSNKIMLGERYNVAVQYTAEMSGNVTVDFANLQLQRETNSSDKRGYVAGGFAIYHNGVKIAPVDADYYYYKSANAYDLSNSPVPTDEGNLLAMFRADGELTLDVKKGDTIEVRAFKDDGASRMFIINPTINYNEVPSKPVITGGGVTVGQVPLRTGMYVDMVNRVEEIVRPEDAVIVEGFTLDIYASLNAPRTDFLPADFELDGMNMPYGVMLIYWSEKGEMGVLPATWYQNNTKDGASFADIDFRFQLPAIKAEDISTNYLVCPIIIYGDGSTYPDMEAYNDFEDFMYYEGEIFSVSKYASLVLESPEMDNDAKLAAGALLNYAAAVNEYFNIEPADFVFPDGEMPVLPSITPEDVYNLTEFDGDAKISGATLVIDETISMRIYVDSTANISGWALQMDEDASFETPRNLKDLVLKRNSKGKYYVDVEIPTMNFGDAFYFRVVDQNGDQQSGVLTYSVESYVARMQGTGSAELLNLLDAMLTLCKVSNDVA
ncbi:MAG: InlB B-repeat-containing protein [Clostridia bacterium]|nr:InlB B-repeat-containing protein [Clostridia bacterium]